MNRCTECAEREAPANDREQHGRFHAVNLLLVDVKLVGEVGHGNRPCNTRSPALSPSSYLVICIGAVTGRHTETSTRLDLNASLYCRETRFYGAETKVPKWLQKSTRQIAETTCAQESPPARDRAPECNLE